jgi:hypothetical protein
MLFITTERDLNHFPVESYYDLIQNFRFIICHKVPPEKRWVTGAVKLQAFLNSTQGGSHWLHLWEERNHDILWLRNWVLPRNYFKLVTKRKKKKSGTAVGPKPGLPPRHTWQWLKFPDGWIQIDVLKKICLPKSDSTQSGRNLPTFRSKLLAVFSG